MAAISAFDAAYESAWGHNSERPPSPSAFDTRPVCSAFVGCRKDGVGVAAEGLRADGMRWVGYTRCSRIRIVSGRHRRQGHQYGAAGLPSLHRLTMFVSNKFVRSFSGSLLCAPSANRTMATVRSSLPHVERTAVRKSRAKTLDRTLTIEQKEPRENGVEPVVLANVREVNDSIRTLRLNAADPNHSIKVHCSS